MTRLQELLEKYPEIKARLEELARLNARNNPSLPLEQIRESLGLVSSGYKPRNQEPGTIKMSIV